MDGVKIATHAGTSPNTALNWQAVNFSFTGTGGNQTIRILTDGTASQCNGRGAMLDDIKLLEEMPINTGYQGSAIRLSAVIAALTDTDGSEVLAVTVGAIPTGALLTDGTRSFTATDSLHLANVTGWNLGKLAITAPTGFTGTFSLTIAASATETATGDTASHALNLPVTVVPTNVTSTLVIDLNGDGVQTTAYGDSKGRFNLLNNGTEIGSGWISAQDGFLAIDSNGNGKIDDRSELFGGEIGEGYAKLATFDSNHDGKVDAKDARYKELKVWRDAPSPLSNSLPQAGDLLAGSRPLRSDSVAGERTNEKNTLQLSGNHQTDAGELHSLSDMGIASLNVKHTIVPEQQNGNWLLERGLVTFKDGRTAAMADAYFEIDPQDRAGKGSSASITLRSDRKQTENLGIPTDDESINRKLGANAVKFFDARKIYKSASIDWNTSNMMQYNPNVIAEEEKKKRQNADKGKKESWLADFLGASSSTEKKDAAKLTGLKVVLGGGEEDKG